VLVTSSASLNYCQHRNYSLPFILDAIAGSWLPINVFGSWVMSRPTREMADGGGIDYPWRLLTFTKPSPTVVFVNFKPFAALLWLFSMQAMCILHELDTNAV
jgi:hypothetical protein